MRKDKHKVVGEPMTDEQVAVFLSHDFERFLSMFQAAGHDVAALNAQGRSFAQTISDHAQAEDYLAALQAAQAGAAN